MSRFTHLAAALAALTLTACGTATVVKQDAYGGQIALDGAFMKSMGDARTLMAEHCRGRSTVSVDPSDPKRIAYRCTDKRLSAR